jgi:hypothetical protein
MPSHSDSELVFVVTLLSLRLHQTPASNDLSLDVVWFQSVPFGACMHAPEVLISYLGVLKVSAALFYLHDMRSPPFCIIGIQQC